MAVASQGAAFSSKGGDGSGLNGEDMGPQGLVAGHAYSLLDAKAFKVKGLNKPKKTKAVRSSRHVAAALVLAVCAADSRLVL